MKGKKFIAIISIVCILAVILCVPAFATVTESNGDGLALYNGIKLPKLPTELDISEYPYLYMDNTAIGPYYYLYFMKKPMLWDDQSNSPVIQEGAGRLMYPFLKGWDTWGQRSDEFLNSTNMTGSPVLWVNHNVYKSDGSIALEASEPASLDGMTVIEWDGYAYGLPNLSEMGEPSLYIVDDTFLDLSDEIPYYLRLTIGHGNFPDHTVYGNLGQLFDLDYTRQSIADGVYWSRNFGGLGQSLLLSGDVPSYNLTGTAFYSSIDEDIGQMYTSLFAYRTIEEPPEEGGDTPDEPQPPFGAAEIYLKLHLLALTPQLK